MRTLMLAMALCLSPTVLAGEPVTFESLLKEMVDRDALARFPDPAYTCKQFSSYDRASTSPDEPKTWFANGDYNQFVRVEEAPAADGKKRKEWVLADMDGPGAVVRIWSANPKGNLRVYLEGNAEPVIVAPMADALGGKWKVAKPLSEESSRGWNLFLPIPYAKHCKVTSDSDGFYYQVNYRTYAAGTPVAPLSRETAEALADGRLVATQTSLVATAIDRQVGEPAPLTLRSGESKDFDLGPGPRVVTRVDLSISTPDKNALEQALRSTVIIGEFDGEQTIWCPVSDFFGSGVGASPFRDWYRGVGPFFTSEWRMPYEASGKLILSNLGTSPVTVALTFKRTDKPWDSRSMHFHAAWHAEYPIHTGAGNNGPFRDWNYLQATGRGVYVGDSLAVMNPVAEWWGEGDEKIYVDGEKFPSHFGTGTEDYYGYAWCFPVPFQSPFHGQARCDGEKGGNNWGHTTVSRVRLLDGIPFTKSFKFDMEIWHWRECDVAYAATTYFYAMPGVTTNRKPQPEEAAKPVPQPPALPPPFTILGAIECERLKVLAHTPGITVVPQGTKDFGQRKWSAEEQLWVQGKAAGAFVELEVPTGPGNKPVKVTLYATRSWDYGVVRFSINGTQAGKDTDLFSGEHGQARPSGPIELGTFQPKDGRLVLRAEIVGANEKSEGTKSFFGLDCVVLTPAPAP